jgi:hypothetical protein
MITLTFESRRGIIAGNKVLLTTLQKLFSQRFKPDWRYFKGVDFEESKVLSRMSRNKTHMMSRNLKALNHFFFLVFVQTSKASAVGMCDFQK